MTLPTTLIDNLSAEFDHNGLNNSNRIQSPSYHSDSLLLTGAGSHYNAPLISHHAPPDRLMNSLNDVDNWKSSISRHHHPSRSEVILVDNSCHGEILEVDSNFLRSDEEVKSTRIRRCRSRKEIETRSPLFSTRQGITVTSKPLESNLVQLRDQIRQSCQLLNQLPSKLDIRDFSICRVFRRHLGAIVEQMQDLIADHFDGDSDGPFDEVINRLADIVETRRGSPALILLWLIDIGKCIRHYDRLLASAVGDVGMTFDLLPSDFAHLVNAIYTRVMALAQSRVVCQYYYAPEHVNLFSSPLNGRLDTRLAQIERQCHCTIRPVHDDHHSLPSPPGWRLIKVTFDPVRGRTTAARRLLTRQLEKLTPSWQSALLVKQPARVLTRQCNGKIGLPSMDQLATIGMALPGRHLLNHIQTRIEEGL